MPRVRSLTLYCLLSLIALCLAVPAQAQAQANNSPEPMPMSERDPVRALLGEVHLLRLAFQRWNLNAHRAQIVVERVRAQQEHVDRLRKDLDELRKQMIELKLEQSRLTAFIKDLEDQISREQINLRRLELTAQLKRLKLELEQHGQREQAQRDREMHLSGQLQVDEAKLRELNERLDALEKDLEIQQSANKP